MGRDNTQKNTKTQTHNMDSKIQETRKKIKRENFKKI